MLLQVQIGKQGTFSAKDVQPVNTYELLQEGDFNSCSEEFQDEQPYIGKVSQINEDEVGVVG